MESPSCYCWISADKTESSHFKKCRTEKIPCITIRDKGNGIAGVNYDYFSMTKVKLGVSKKIREFYRNYIDLMGLEEVEAGNPPVGSEASMLFYVKKDHADFIADFLYRYILLTYHNADNKLTI